MIGLSVYGRVLARRWWVVLLVFAVTVGATGVLTARQSGVYRASSLSAVTPASRVEGNDDIIRSLDTLDRRSVIATIARVPDTSEALAAAAEDLGWEKADLRGYSVRATIVPSTNIISISVEGPDPAAAADLANSLTDVTDIEARRMYKLFKLHKLAAANAASRPISPVPRRNYLAGTILGFFLGVGTAFATDAFRHSDIN